MAIELMKIDADVDGLGMSIKRRQYTTINGVNYYSDPERKAFRKTEVNDAGQSVVNANYSSDIDSWTGVTNFLTTVYNQQDKTWRLIQISLH